MFIRGVMTLVTSAVLTLSDGWSAPAGAQSSDGPDLAASASLPSGCTVSLHRVSGNSLLGEVTLAGKSVSYTSTGKSLGHFPRDIDETARIEIPDMWSHTTDSSIVGSKQWSVVVEQRTGEPTTLTKSLVSSSASGRRSTAGIGLTKFTLLWSKIVRESRPDTGPSSVRTVMTGQTGIKQLINGRRVYNGGNSYQFVYAVTDAGALVRYTLPEPGSTVAPKRLVLRGAGLGGYREVTHAACSGDVFVGITTDGRAELWRDSTPFASDRNVSRAGTIATGITGALYDA